MMESALKRICMNWERKGNMSDFSAPKTKTGSSAAVRRMTAAALLAAMTTLMTAYLFHIPVGVNGGYIHFGDAIIYFAAALLPMPYACAVGAIGGGMADLLTAPMWAPATVLIKALICLPFSSKGNKIVTKRNTAALFFAFCISAVGYYVAEGILFGFTAAFFTSAAGSLIQSAGCAVVFLILGTALDRVGVKISAARGL